MNNVEVIVIGDELLLGQVTDTNSGEIARRLGPSGLTVSRVTVVGDNGADIRRAIDAALASADIVITTGGLGPTKDDITKSVMTEIFGGELRLDEATLENVRDVVARRSITLNALTEAQAMVPTSCEVIQNRVGTAPIMWFERDGKVLVAMPGVPFETREMLVREVAPRLVRRFVGGEVAAHKTVITHGIIESALAELLEPWEESLPDGYHLAYLPRPGLVRLRIDGPAGETLDALHRDLTERLGAYVLADDDLTPPEILLNELRDRSLTLATAESCTGGNIAHELTLIAGSSDVFAGGVVSYSNDVKMKLLSVSADTLAAHGAVSEEVVAEMARGAREATGADVAVATSGIAGPSGAVPGKPVGTVCMGVATPRGVVTATGHFPGNRARVIDRATMEVIIMAIKEVRR